MSCFFLFFASLRYGLALCGEEEKKNHRPKYCILHYLCNIHIICYKWHNQSRERMRKKREREREKKNRISYYLHRCFAECSSLKRTTELWEPGKCLFNGSNSAWEHTHTNLHQPYIFNVPIYIYVWRVFAIIFYFFVSLLFSFFFFLHTPLYDADNIYVMMTFIIMIFFSFAFSCCPLLPWHRRSHRKWASKLFELETTKLPHQRLNTWNTKLLSKFSFFIFFFCLLSLA